MCICSCINDRKKKKLNHKWPENYWRIAQKSGLSWTRYTYEKSQLRQSAVTFVKPVREERQITLLSVTLGEGNGTPLQFSCLENPVDGGAWWAAVHRVAKSRTWLSDFTFTFHFHALEKEMATHSSVLTWRIPGMGSHRVRHDWSDLAAAVAVGSELMPSNAIFVLKWFIEV